MCGLSVYIPPEYIIQPKSPGIPETKFIDYLLLARSRESPFEVYKLTAKVAAQLSKRPRCLKNSTRRQHVHGTYSASFPRSLSNTHPAFNLTERDSTHLGWGHFPQPRPWLAALLRMSGPCSSRPYWLPRLSRDEAGQEGMMFLDSDTAVSSIFISSHYRLSWGCSIR